MAVEALFVEEELNRLYTEMAKVVTGYSTSITGNEKAIQQRVVNRFDAQRRFVIDYGGCDPEEQQALVDFHLTKFGRAYGFRFYPPNDRDFRNDVLGVGDGTTTRFYLRRNHLSRDVFVTRRIVKPIWPLLTVTVNGSKVRIDDPVEGEITPAGPEAIVDNPITVDWNMGFFDFETAPANGAIIRAARGQYHIPVNFESDDLESSDYGPFADLMQVGLREILPTALNAPGNSITPLTLRFVMPLSGSSVPEPFSASFASQGVTKVWLFVNGTLIGSSTSGPTFPFTGITRPDGPFLMEAIGINGSGQIVVAAILLFGIVAVVYNVVRGAGNNVKYGGNQVTYRTYPT